MSRLLHSENFDICRICLREPEANRNINFLDIFKPLNGGKTIREYMKNLLDLNVKTNDQRPRIICETCYISIVQINETLEKAAESRVIINYLNSKESDDTRYHGQFVSSNSGVLKAITSNTDATRENESKCIQTISNLEGPEYDPLDGSDAIDPYEPRYCLCDQVAFGTMIACDHKACITEWFHCGCVGIMKPPRGKWYCPKCRNIVKKLKMSKKNPHKTLCIE